MYMEWRQWLRGRHSLDKVTDGLEVLPGAVVAALPARGRSSGDSTATGRGQFPESGTSRSRSGLNGRGGISGGPCRGHNTCSAIRVPRRMVSPVVRLLLPTVDVLCQCLFSTFARRSFRPDVACCLPRDDSTLVGRSLKAERAHFVQFMGVSVAAVA